ncbi:hypothetical protein FOL47_009035 [Perkinsus chesapeaki]|uniref:E3 ubiquitin-protein ligase n=1 Tax=Perkinsus chesapeaki TaxID=330153 RepID=A0A7J6LAQ3_PERCH|nr:hypothetical protein FOL47_009035 [Perkinsus chesapeaki]
MTAAKVGNMKTMLSQVSIASDGSAADYPASPNTMSLLKTGWLSDCKLRLSLGDDRFTDAFDLHKSVICPCSRFCWSQVYKAKNPQEILITVPSLPDPHVKEEDVLKCMQIVLSFVYSHQDWDTLIADDSLSLARGERKRCEALMCLFGLSQVLEIDRLSSLLSQYLKKLCHEEACNCALILLRANFYSSAQSHELCEEAEAVLKRKFEECLFGSMPPRLLEFTQLPTSLTSRILLENDLRKGHSRHGESIILKTYFTVTVRSLEGVASGSEVVEGVPVERYEKIFNKTDNSFIITLPAPEDGMRVWTEIEWRGTDNTGHDVVVKESIPAQLGGDAPSAFPVEIALEGGALVRMLSVEKALNSGGCDSVADEMLDFEELYKCVGWSLLTLDQLLSAVESPLWKPAQSRILAHMRQLIARQSESPATSTKCDIGVGIDFTEVGCKRTIDSLENHPGKPSTSPFRKKARLMHASAHRKLIRATKCSPITFLHTRDFSPYGALAWLSTRDPDSITATASGTAEKSSVTHLFGSNTRHFEPGKYFCSAGDGHAWIEIDLGANRELRLHGYCLRSPDTSDELLMNWYLFGSADAAKWDVLDKRTDCKSLLGGASKTSYFPVDEVKESFRFFRLMQFGVNSSGTRVLTCAGIDFYGEAVSGTW